MAGEVEMLFFLLGDLVETAIYSPSYTDIGGVAATGTRVIKT
jgi:hypothetical protein